MKILWINLACVVFVAAVVMVAGVRSGKTPSHRVCVINLKQIRDAKAQWALENRTQDNRAPTERDIFGESDHDIKFLKHRLTCPAGGRYTLGPLNRPPTCSIGGKHTLPAENN